MELKKIKDHIKTRDYLFSEHVDEERTKDNLTVADIEEAIISGEVIEERLNDPRGESRLVAGKSKIGKGVNMNNCYFCIKGKLTKEKVDIVRYWGKELIALNDVPALVCQQCGERYFDAKVSHKIDERIQDALRRKSSIPKIDIPVVQF